MQVDPLQWPDLSRLLDTALEVPVDQREHWLESLATPESQHRDQLRELLNQHVAAETGEFLFTLPKMTSPNGLPAPGAPAFEAGDEVGPYVLEAEIGSGGMGTVWRARRKDGALKRPVALKLLHAGAGGVRNPDRIERFVRERDILGELLHPNIARLDDAGITESGQPYLALEYVSGMPLSDYCDQHQLNLRARLLLFLQVLRAVHYAHTHLVIHRDIKPANVLVTPEGRAMLLDFGIAKFIPDDGVEGAGLSRMGTVVLTPAYASPEQIACKPVSTASDVYSLGVLLFELLTADRPYQLPKSSRAELEQIVLNTAPRRPSEVVRDHPDEVQQLVAESRSTTNKKLTRALQGSLDSIVLKALQKSPVERYVRVDELSRDIQRYLAGEVLGAAEARPRRKLWPRLPRLLSRAETYQGYAAR